MMRADFPAKVLLQRIRQQIRRARARTIVGRKFGPRPGPHFRSSIRRFLIDHWPVWQAHVRVDREGELGLRVWPDYDAIVATCCEAWNWLVAAPDRLASITRREWAK